jgi:hypothetical protein
MGLVVRKVMLTFYTVHLIDLDGGYIGRTWKQWHTRYLVNAHKILAEEMGQPQYIQLNGDYWSSRRELYSPKDNTPLHFSHQVIGNIHTICTNSGYMALYISAEKLTE